MIFFIFSKKPSFWKICFSLSPKFFNISSNLSSSKSPIWVSTSWLKSSVISNKKEILSFVLLWLFTVKFEFDIKFASSFLTQQILLLWLTFLFELYWFLITLKTQIKLTIAIQTYKIVIKFFLQNFISIYKSLPLKYLFIV